jgi:hypothetical protein
MTSREEGNLSEMRCSICMQPIPDGAWGYGHIAEPLNGGRCCSECNSRHVIPARIRRMRAEQSRSG